MSVVNSDPITCPPQCAVFPGWFCDSHRHEVTEAKTLPRVLNISGHILVV